ncbi:MAG: DUF3108 domain-containing protein [Betaproteobacteria bacterium]|nr:DUF3108 domain-containing protein [Betaproteobacteria bacterium]
MATTIASAWAATSAPRQVVTTFDVYRNGFHIAEMRETFETTDGTYRIVSESRAIGLLSLFERRPVRFVSSGVLSADGLRPLRFEGKRSDDDKRRVRGAFDWDAGRLTIENGAQVQTLPLPRGTQDRLSFLYQFMFMAPFKEPRLVLDMTNGRKLGHYLYTLRTGVELDTPLGRMPTVHVVKQHKPDESGTEIWLAAQHRYLPVKMTITEEDGTRYEQVVTRLVVKESAP